MSNLYGYALKGHRLYYIARRRVPANTLIAAMGASGVICYQIFPKGLTLKRWRTFVEEVLLKSLPSNRIVIWDNLDIHCDGQVLEQMSKSGHMVLFTPKYSPEGNPIEYMFNTLKTGLKSKVAKTMKELRKQCQELLEQVTAQHVASYSLVAWGHMFFWQDSPP